MPLQMTRRRPLADMLMAQKDRGTSFRRMSERAAAAGHPISYTQVSDYAHGRIRTMPSEPMTRGLAAALGMPFEQVRSAVLEEWLGVPEQQRSHPITAEESILSSPELSEAEKRVLLATLRALREQGSAGRTNGASGAG